MNIDFALRRIGLQRQRTDNRELQVWRRFAAQFDEGLGESLWVGGRRVGTLSLGLGGADKSGEKRRRDERNLPHWTTSE